jgi:titin
MTRRLCLAVSILVAGPLACERSQPLEPVPALSAASSGGGRAPAAPSGTVALAFGYNRIDVSWIDNSTDELGFELFRSTTGLAGPFTRLTGVSANVTAYVDKGLNALSQYCYEVRAVRIVGVKLKYSAFSNTSCATTPAAAPPAAPWSLTATTYPWQIMLWWSTDMIATDGFMIERCDGTICADSDFVGIDVTPFSSYSDYAATQGLTYTYRVRAFNSVGQSAPSNAASATQCFVEDSGDGTYICTGP